MVSAQSAQPGTPVDEVVRDAVRAAGFELDSLDVARVGKRQVVRVVVDLPEPDPAPDHEPDGPGGATSPAGLDLDAVAVASRAVSNALDGRESLFGGPYTLEVTSPGVDRPLTVPRHWRRNRLRLVRARLAGGGELVGRVGTADEDGVALLVGGELRRIGYAEVAHAVVEIEFRPPPAAELAALGAHGDSEEEA